MRITKLASLAVTLVCLALPGWAETAAEKGLRIATKSADTESGFRDMSADGEMILYSARGATSTRRFENRTVENADNRGSRSLLVFDWPGDIRNTALLTHSFDTAKDDQWLYLPAVRKVRRISSSGRSGSFVGSEFAYEDMVEQDASNFSHVWQRDERCPNGGGTCHVLVRVPKQSSGYSQQAVWLDTAELRYQTIQYYNRRGQLMKTLTISGYRKYKGRFWRPSKMQMVNHLTGKSTVLNWKNYTFNVGLSASEFTPDAVRR